jgi:8-oxo-dGTP pyrophosphatase MutT (NUDIX family)
MDKITKNPDHENITDLLSRKLERNNCDVPLQMENDHQPAAVMILLTQFDGEWHILFTQRTDAVTYHKGQVAFPGGAWETSDSCLRETALRETYEEIGIDREGISILGSMQPVKTITGYYIIPYVGIISWPYEVTIQEQEVESVFTIPFDWLINEKNRAEKEYYDIKNNIRRNVLFYQEYDGHLLWGITAMLTVSLLDLLK